MAPKNIAVIISFLLMPALRADIFVSNGAGGPSANQVWSYSLYTGAFKLAFTGALASSEGLALGPDGNLYVADGVNRSVLRFNPTTGALIGTFVSPISLPSYPEGITFGPDGGLWMADNAGFIRRFDGSSGAPTNTWACNVPSIGPCYPFDLTFGPDGNLYFSDLGSRSVVQFNLSTFAESVFVPAFANDANSFPWGLHFGPNGNLYVVFDFSTANVYGFFYEILEFNGSTGAPISFTIPYGFNGLADFAFAPNTDIYLATDPQFMRLSSSSGALLSTFGSTGIGPQPPGFILIGNTAINLPPYLLCHPVNVVPTQTIRLTVVNGPIRVPPGVPVQAQLGFQNGQGAFVAPPQTVTVNPGQTASVDLNVSTVISSGRIQLQPVVTALPGAPLVGSLAGSLEVFNTSSGFGSLFYSGVPAATGITGPPSFLPQGVAFGQNMLINVAAPPDSPCMALLGFQDMNGNAIGPSQQVNLSPGTMTSLNFNTNRYTKSLRQEYVPQITPNNPAGGPGVASSCLGSVEVYYPKNGTVQTFQTSSPAIGTPAGVP